MAAGRAALGQPLNPDVAVAVEDLRGRGVLTDGQARLFGRVARAQLVSIEGELRALLYLGVLLTVAGVGWLLKDQMTRLSPLTIVALLALAAAGCFAWVQRRAPAFTWGAAPAAHIGLEYVLLLTVLLAAADLAYAETKFSALGAQWPWHLLIVSLGAGALAFRYDSKLVLSLAVSSFAAWRGASVQLLERSLWLSFGEAASLRANAIGCGLLFLAAGAALARARAKPHFEPVLTHSGWLLVLCGLASGLGLGDRSQVGYELALLAVGAGLALASFGRRRFSLFAFGVVAAYVGLTALFLRVSPGDTAAALWFFLTSLALLLLLGFAHWRLKEAA
jgi:hypothetical protein